MINKLNESNPLLEEMGLKLLGMSANTIKWSCLFSGAGIPCLSDKENEDGLIKKSDENMCILNCLYKKANPEYKMSHIGDPKATLWANKSFNKEISPVTQAFTILSLCNLSELLYEEDPYLGNILLKNAEMIHAFTSSQLRGKDGLFVPYEDKTKACHREIRLKPLKHQPRLTEQIYFFEASLYLNYITSNETYREYNNEKSENYLIEARNIFNYVFENYHYLLELTSKQISLIISSLTRCCELEGDITQLSNYSQLIALLCAELETRIKVTGEVERNFNNTTTASLVTHFRTASAFLEGASITGIRKFENHSHNIIDYVFRLFDYSKGLFILGDSNEISYSIRDISEILKSMFEIYSIDQDETQLKIILSFYNSTFEKSGIFPYSLEGFPKSLDTNISAMLSFINPSDIKKAPVFLKSFRFSYKKLSTYNCSKHFNSEYALYSSYIFLNYLSKHL